MDKQLTDLALQLGEGLKEKGMMIATAESCTGGGIAQAITEIPGSSTWFDRGFVTYSNKAKVEMLQVKQSTLDEYGAVSEAVAIEMVEGALQNSDADLAIAVTGIAGPEGGSKEKPVGTVFIACGIKEDQITCSQYVFLGVRGAVRRETVRKALENCLEKRD